MERPFQKSLFDEIGDKGKPVVTQESVIKNQAVLSAIGNASSIKDEWARAAFVFLLNYSAANASFTSEDLRIAGMGKVPDTQDSRAWGPVLKIAAKRGIIKKEGFKKGIMAHCHRATKTLWESQYFAGTKKEGETKKTSPKKKYTINNIEEVFNKAVELCGKTVEEIADKKKEFFRDKFNIRIK